LIDQKQAQQKGRDIPELVTHSQIEQSNQNASWKERYWEMETRKKDPGIWQIDTTPK